MSTRPPLSDDDELLAAELALELIDGDERRAAERRAATDAGFAAALARWRDRAALLLDGPGETPPPSVWRGIALRLPANDTAPTASPVAARGWQIATALASACALVLGVLLVTRPAPPPAPVPVTHPVAVAPAPAAAPLLVVLRGKAQAVVAVTYEPGNRRLTVAPSSLEPARHSAQLWVIAPGAKPYSLGLVAPAGPSIRIASADAAHLIAPGATLAISLEPPGGAPHGQPTGTIIVTGTIAAS